MGDILGCGKLAPKVVLGCGVEPLRAGRVILILQHCQDHAAELSQQLVEGLLCGVCPGQGFSENFSNHGRVVEALWCLLLCPLSNQVWS